MTAEQFCYWLQGFAEITRTGQPDPVQWNQIKEHLATVFHKVTPIPTPALAPAPYPPVTWPGDTTAVPAWRARNDIAIC